MKMFMFGYKKYFEGTLNFFFTFLIFVYRFLTIKAKKFFYFFLMICSLVSCGSKLYFKYPKGYTYSEILMFKSLGFFLY